jgi:hypothetical protein
MLDDDEAVFGVLQGGDQQAANQTEGRGASSGSWEKV